MKRAMAAIMIIGVSLTLLTGCPKPLPQPDNGVITQSDPIWEGATCKATDVLLKAADVALGGGIVANPQVTLYYTAARPVAQLFWDAYCTGK